MFEAPSPSDLLLRVCDRGRAHNRAAAALYAGIGALYRQRLAEVGDRAEWVHDTDDAVATEVAVALRISQGLAMSYLRTARCMHERLPQLAAVFEAGDIDFTLFDALAYRTDLIDDPDSLAAVDTELATKVPSWPSLSRSQIFRRADRIVIRHDRDAIRRRKKAIEDRRLDIWNSGDGTSEIRGHLRNYTADALNERVDSLAATVCPNDPRPLAARRADALDAILAHQDRMDCECGRPDCTAAEKPAARPVVIHVVANQATLDGDDTPGLSASGDLIPADEVRELARRARLVPVLHPHDAPPEPGYVPSRALAEFVRARDVTCRFPGCDTPARQCDIDHTTPYGDNGVTHASNLKCLCRRNHLDKTFGGWRDKQLRDGTIIWTAPSGEVYITLPGGADLFPTLMAPTGALPDTSPATSQYGDRTQKIPKRRTTRAENRRRRIADERRSNRNDRDAAAQTERWEQMIRVGLKAQPPPF
jgi:hypothetical protein